MGVFSSWSEFRVDTKLGDSSKVILRRLFSGGDYDFDVTRNIYGSDINCYLHSDSIVIADWRYFWQSGKSLEVSSDPRCVVLSGKQMLLNPDSGTLKWIDRQLNDYDASDLCRLASVSYNGRFGKNNEGRLDRMSKNRAFRRDKKIVLKDLPSVFNESEIKTIRQIVARSNGFRLYSGTIRRLGGSFIKVDLAFMVGEWSESLYVLSHVPTDEELSAISAASQKTGSRVERVVIMVREAGETVEDYFSRLQASIPMLKAEPKMTFSDYFLQKYGTTDWRKAHDVQRI